MGSLEIKMNNYVSEAHKKWRNGQEEEMLPLLKKAAEIAEQLEDIPKLIEINSEYGGALRVTGYLEQSIEVLSRVSLLIKDNYGKNTIPYATSLVNLANAYRVAEKHTTSLEKFIQAKTIYDNNSHYDYEYISLCNNLSLLYQALGQTKNAIELSNETISKLKGKANLKVPLGITYCNLAGIYLQAKEFDLAKINMNLADKLLSIMVGKFHPLYAALLNVRGQYHELNGDLELSYDYYQKSQSILLETYGSQSPDYLSVSENISRLEAMLYPKGKFGVGMQRSKGFYYEHVKNYLKEAFPDLVENLACGLVGMGSECLGYDDEISQDHDFETRVYIWLPESILKRNKKSLERITNKFENHVIAQSIEDFYEHFTGFAEGPKTDEDYLKIPSHYLKTATNGVVFQDNLGVFTKIRNKILNFYPADVKYKKIAYHLTQIAQSGQYNFNRCLRRGDLIGCHLALSEFIQHYSSLIHLINNKYEPFYKWMSHSLAECVYLGKISRVDLVKLLEVEMKQKSKIIEQLCQRLIDYFVQRDWVEYKSSFTLDYIDDILEKIENHDLKNINPWVLY